VSKNEFPNDKVEELKTRQMSKMSIFRSKSCFPLYMLWVYEQGIAIFGHPDTPKWANIRTFKYSIL